MWLAIGVAGVVVIAGGVGLVLALRPDRPGAVAKVDPAPPDQPGPKGDQPAEPSPPTKAASDQPADALVPGTFAAAAADAWKSFQTADGSLSVTAPGDFAEVPALSDGKRQWILVLPGVQYGVEHEPDTSPAPRVGDKPKTPDQTLEDRVKLFTAFLKKGARVVAEKPGLRQGAFPGYEVLAELPGRGQFRLRFWFAHGRHYQASVTGTQETVASADADRFLDSFKILRTAPDPPAPPAPAPLPMWTRDQVRKQFLNMDLPDGRTLIGFSESSLSARRNHLAVFDPVTDRATVAFDLLLLFHMPAVAVSADGTRLAALSLQDRRILFFETATGQRLGVTELPFEWDVSWRLEAFAVRAGDAGVVGVVGPTTFIARPGDKTATVLDAGFPKGTRVAYLRGPDLLVGAVPTGDVPGPKVKSEASEFLAFRSPAGGPVPAPIPIPAGRIHRVDLLTATPDGKTVVVALGSQAGVSLMTCTPADGKWTKFKPGGDGPDEPIHWDGVDVSADGAFVAGRASRFTRALRVHLYRRDGSLVRAVPLTPDDAPQSIGFAGNGKTVRVVLKHDHLNSPPRYLTLDAATGQPPAAPTGPAPVLRWKFQAGDRRRYRLEEEVEVATFEDRQESLNVMDTTWRVQSVRPDGGAVVGVSFDRARIKYKRGGRAVDFDSGDPKQKKAPTLAWLEKALGKEFLVTIGPRGEVEAVRHSDALAKALTDPAGETSAGQGLFEEAAVEDQLSGLLPLLSPPGAPQRTWKGIRTVPVVKHVTLNYDIAYEAVGPRARPGGTAVEKVVSKHTVTARVEPGTPGAATLRTQVVGGTFLFDPAAGRLVENTVTGFLSYSATDGKEKQNVAVSMRSTLKALDP